MAEVTMPLFTSSAGNAGQQAHGVVVLDSSGKDVNNAITYKQVAASQANSLLGNASGDVLNRVAIIPSAANPGNVTLKDGNVSIPLFIAGGNVSDGKPFTIDFGFRGLTSVGGNLTMTTGAGVSVLALGKFTAP